MNIILTEQARDDIAFWNRTDPSKTARIKELLKSIVQTPFSGIGKPEALKYSLTGCYSRRIDREHRLVYRLEGENIIVLQCRYHY